MNTSRPADLESMALRTLMAAFPGTELPPWVQDRLGAGLGSVCLFGSNVSSADQLGMLTGAIHAAGPEVLVATDEEGGDVTRLHMREASPQPGNAALGAADQPRLTAAVAAAIGTELAVAGVDLDLAPVVDVNSNPDNPVIGVRSFGADPALVARHTRAYVEGLQAAGVAACAKHFPGHGDTAVDSHLGLPRLEASLEVLRARELVPFGAAVDAGAVAVMTSHVLVPAVDPSLPATLSAPVLRLLRDELGFTGLLVSDALDMAGAHAGRGESAAAVLALAAGCDLLCLGPDKDAAHVDAVVAAVVDAVTSRALPEQRLAEAADRVLAAGRQVQKWRADGGAPSYDGTAGAAVARRAIRVAGRLAPVRGACVLRFRTTSNIAVGEVPWGLPEAGTVLGGTPHVDVDETTTVDELLGRAEGRPMVALVREAHRHAWVTERLTQLAAARPDLVSVEMGWPGPSPLPGAATVTTFGASRANGTALDAVLAGGR